MATTTRTPLCKLQNVPMAEGTGDVAVHIERRTGDGPGHGWTWFIYRQPAGSRPRPPKNVNEAMKQVTKTRSLNPTSQQHPKCWVKTRTTELNANRRDSYEYSAYKVEAELTQQEATDLLFHRGVANPNRNRASASGTRETAGNLGDIFDAFDDKPRPSTPPAENLFYQAAPSTTTVQRPAPDREHVTRRVTVDGEWYTIDSMGRWHDSDGHILEKGYAQKLQAMLDTPPAPPPQPIRVPAIDEETKMLLRELLAKLTQ